MRELAFSHAAGSPPEGNARGRSACGREKRKV